ncbi:MAG: hypothetical protein NTW94_03550, partial [Legionellales bacterium]|nr:hypothetical protein [Legionellales bacterium]
MSATAPSTNSSGRAGLEALLKEGGEDRGEMVRLLGKFPLLGAVGISALSQIAVAMIKKGEAMSADKLAVIGDWINLCTKDRMLNADLPEILAAIKDADWSRIGLVSKRRGDNNVFSEEDDTINEWEEFSSWGYKEVTKLMEEIDKGTKTQTIMFNTSFQMDVNKIGDVHKELSALSILKAIEVRNLDRDTIGRVIKDTEKFFSLKKEICDVFNSMKSKRLSPIGVRDAILDLAIDSTNGQSLKNLKAMIDALDSSVSLDKDEMKVIIDKLHKLGSTDIMGRVLAVSTCIKIMKNNNVRLRSMRDINKLGKLMEMEERPLKKMAGVLAAAEGHPLFKKHPNDFFDYIYEQRLQMGDAEINEDGKIALNVTFSKMSGVTLNRRGSFKPMVGRILQMTNDELVGMAKLIGAVGGAQFIADPNDICACLSENLDKLYPKTGAERGRPAEFRLNVDAAVGCINVMIAKSIALVGTVRADKLKALMKLPHKQLRNAQKIMEALSAAGAFDRNPNDRFNILLKNIAHITADPIRTDSLIVAIKLMNAMHWNGSMFDITNSVMSRLMELSTEKLWGFTESLRGGALVGVRSGVEVHELLREGRTPGGPGKAVYDSMIGLCAVEREEACGGGGGGGGGGEGVEIREEWSRALAGAAGRGWDLGGIATWAEKVAGCSAGDMRALQAGGVDAVGGARSEGVHETDGEPEGRGGGRVDEMEEESEWEKVYELVERGPVAGSRGVGVTEANVREWMDSVKEAAA